MSRWRRVRYGFEKVDRDFNRRLAAASNDGFDQLPASIGDDGCMLRITRQAR
jgi:hypothetical protein